jgi:hypothetical protein
MARNALVRLGFAMSVDWTGSSGRGVKPTRLTRLYGPAVRCKRFRQPGRCGLASMYPASDWSVCALGHHGYQRAFELISGQASTGPFGSPVFACAGKTDPPSLSHSSRRPRRVTGVVVTSSNVPHFALFLCSCLAVVPSSRPAHADAPRAEGRQGRPSCCPDVLLYRGQAAP